MANDTGKYFTEEEVFGNPIPVQFNYRSREQEYVVVQLGSLRNGNHKVSLSRFVSNERTGYSGISRDRGFMFDDLDELQNLVDALQVAINHSRPIMDADAPDNGTSTGSSGGGLPTATVQLTPGGQAAKAARQRQASK
jgi:hypothetical protein